MTKQKTGSLVGTKKVVHVLTEEILTRDFGDGPMTFPSYRPACNVTGRGGLNIYFPTGGPVTCKLCLADNNTGIEAE